MPVEVRQARVADAAVIDSFIKATYGAEAPYKAEARRAWQFLRNPFASRDGDLIPVWIAVEHGQVVGQIAVQPTALQVEDETYAAGWIVDVMVRDSHRGLGLGHRLHQPIPTKVPILLTLTMAPATRRIAERFGCATLPPVRQFSKWVRLDADTVRRYLLARTLHRPRWHATARFLCSYLRVNHLIPPLANLWLRLRGAVRRHPRKSGRNAIVEVDRFGEDVDEFWSSVRKSLQAVVPRTSQFLNWRFVDCPQMTYRRFVARREGRTVGYVVLRKSDPVEISAGTIADILADKDDTDTFEDLVVESISRLGRYVATIQCASSIRPFETVLRRLGFFVTRTHRPTVVCLDLELRAKLEGSEWYFTKADHDWDQIHPA